MENDLNSPVYEQQNYEQQNYEQQTYNREPEQANQAWQIVDENEKLSNITSNINVNKKKKTVAAFVWRDDLINYFITQWNSECCLFDVNNPDYSTKDKRMLALERIRENMSAREFHPLPAIHDLITKMASLRTYYYSQLKKYRASLQGTRKGANKVCKIKWKFFESLEFLSDSATPRETLSTIDDDDQNQENIQPYAAPTVPSVIPVPNVSTSKQTRT